MSSEGGEHNARLRSRPVKRKAPSDQMQSAPSRCRSDSLDSDRGTDSVEPRLGRHLIRRMSREVIQDPQPPDTSPGAEWWQAPLWGSMLHVRADLPCQSKRPLKVLSMCSGTLGEVSACRALSIPVVYEGSDTKQSACTFVMNNYSSVVEHFYNDSAALASGRGQCLKHGTECQTSFEGRPDVLTAGTPCQPFSHFRQRAGPHGSRMSSTARGHPDFQITFGMVEDVVRARRPLTCIFEQVSGFNQQEHGEQETYLKQFTDMLMRYYGGVRAVRMDASTWAAGLSRQRIYIAAFDDTAGGARAAAKWASRMQEIHNFRKVLPLTQIFGADGIVGPADREEAVRFYAKHGAKHGGGDTCLAQRCHTLCFFPRLGSPGPSSVAVLGGVLICEHVPTVAELGPNYLRRCMDRGPVGPPCRGPVYIGCVPFCLCYTGL